MLVTNRETLKSKSVDYDAEEHELVEIVNILEKELENSEVAGAGLSAIQIGIPVRIAIVRTSKCALTLYNAKILSASDCINFEGEGCLSIPDTYVTTTRMNKIKVKNGNGAIHELEGFEAIVVQHELDHWDGILMTDRSI